MRWSKTFARWFGRKLLLLGLDLTQGELAVGTEDGSHRVVLYLFGLRLSMHPELARALGRNLVGCAHIAEQKPKNDHVKLYDEVPHHLAAE
jgi:hypothetical protein